MAIQQHFEKFNKNIYLTNKSDGYKKASEKANSILEEIKKEFKEKGYSIKSTKLQGSFQVDTAIHSINGDYDIDRAIFIDANDAPDDPVEPKKVIKSVLEKRNFKEPKIKKPCVTADYKSTNLHIDYTVYKQGKDLFGRDIWHLAIGKEGSDWDNKKWADADPQALIDWIEKSDNYGVSATAKKKQYKRLVRYLKRWRDVNFQEEVRKKVFSIALTVMVKEQYKPNPDSESINDDLVVLQKVISNILNNNYFQQEIFADDYRVYTPLPTLPKRDIFQHKVDGGGSRDGSDRNTGTQFRNKLKKLLRNGPNCLNT